MSRQTVLEHESANHEL